MIKVHNAQCSTCNKKQGFTLIELIMVIVMMGVLAGLGVPVLVKLFDSFRYVVYRKDLSESAEVASRRMSREIRRLRDDTSVITADSTAYRFVDVDGAAVQFRLNGTDLEREYNGVTDILAAGISSLAFTYLNDARAAIGSPLVNPQPTDVRFVRIDMTLQGYGNTINCRVEVRLRNVIHI